jgi:hypothetical protein
MQKKEQKVIVVNPLTGNIQKWMFDRSEVEFRSARDIVQTLHQSGELTGQQHDWKMSYQGVMLDDNRPLAQQVNFDQMETRLNVQPIVAGGNFE